MTNRSLVVTVILLSNFLPEKAALSQSTMLQELASSESESPTQLVVNRDRANRLVVQVMINDQGPFDFLLDTGANQSAVSASLAERMQLGAAAPARLQGVTGEATVPRVKVAKLEAGSLLLKNQKLAVIAATINGLDGVLGVDGFRGKRVAAHIVNNVVTIERSRQRREQAVYADYATFPLELRHGLLALIPASVSGAEIKAVIDTGSEGTLGTESLRRTLVSGPDASGTPNMMRVQGVTGDVQRGRSHMTSLIRLDCVERGSYQYILIRDVPVTYGEFYVFTLWGLQRESALLVGMDILGRMEEVVIDYGNKQMHWKQRT